MGPDHHSAVSATDLFVLYRVQYFRAHCRKALFHALSGFGIACALSNLRKDVEDPIGVPIKTSEEWESCGKVHSY